MSWLLQIPRERIIHIRYELLHHHSTAACPGADLLYRLKYDLTAGISASEQSSSFYPLRENALHAHGELSYIPRLTCLFLSWVVIRSLSQKLWRNRLERHSVPDQL